MNHSPVTKRVLEFMLHFRKQSRFLFKIVIKKEALKLFKISRKRSRSLRTCDRRLQVQTARKMFKEVLQQERARKQQQTSQTSVLKCSSIFQIQQRFNSKSEKIVCSDSDKEGIQINKNRSNIFITRKKVKSSTLKHLCRQ